MSSEYSRLFHVRRVHTRDLMVPGVLEHLRELGYAYIRKYECGNYNAILRNPTIGCIAELSYYRQVDSVPIDSPRGQRLIRRLNYY